MNKKYIFGMLCAFALPTIVSAAVFSLVNNTDESYYAIVTAGKTANDAKVKFTGQIAPKKSVSIDSGLNDNVYIECSTLDRSKSESIKISLSGIDKAKVINKKVEINGFGDFSQNLTSNSIPQIKDNLDKISKSTMYGW